MQEKILRFLGNTISKLGLSGKGLHKIPGVAQFIKLMKPAGIVLVNVQGNKMYVDCKDKFMAPPLLMHGYYEKDITKILTDQVKPGMTFVDIGANFGYYSLMASKLVRRHGKVYAFEPEPHNYSILSKNVHINNCKNIVLLQKAVSNTIGRVKLFKDEVNLGAPSFSQLNIDKKDGFVYVETVDLDSYFKDLHVDFIKMDAQGAEGFIIDGAEKILKGELQIIMEFWPRGLKNAGTNPLNLLYKIEKAGFEINLIENGSAHSVKISELMKIYNSKKGCEDHVNLLLKRS